MTTKPNSEISLRGVHVSIADDEWRILESLKRALEKHGMVVNVMATNGEELLDKLENNTTTQIVFMDGAMPILDGIAATRKLCELHPGIKVIAMSQLPGDEVKIAMLRAGACAFLSKTAIQAANYPKMEAEFLNCIRSVLGIGVYDAHDMLSLALPYMRKDASPPAIEFNNREIEFLKCYCEELTLEEIANKLHKGIGSINKYAKSMNTKLGVISRLGAVRMVMQKFPWILDERMTPSRTTLVNAFLQMLMGNKKEAGILH